jgi:hypothetical protein
VAEILKGASYAQGDASMLKRVGKGDRNGPTFVCTFSAFAKKQ